jgi:hypothetical protein
MNEPIITINGTELNVAQAMTVRVALTSFQFDLAEKGLGNDEHGRLMTQSYQKHATDVQDLIHGRPKPPLN